MGTVIAVVVVIGATFFVFYGLTHWNDPAAVAARAKAAQKQAAKVRSKRTVVDAEGNVTCGNCGAKNNFATRRAFFESKKVRCMGCGRLLSMR